MKPLLNLLLILVAIGLIGCSKPASPSTAQTQSEPAEVVAQKAVAGVGKKGQSLKDNQGIAKVISGPAAAYFNVEQKAVLEWQIPQALQMYKASEGRFPKNHQEFMERIVDANKLSLPELPKGAVYRFDPEKGELWVYPENDVPK